MTDTPSPTPETDAQFSAKRTFPAGIQELREFAARMEKERDEARSEVARLKAGGCARDQRTTQFCAEAVKAIAERDEARAAIKCAYIENQNLHCATTISPRICRDALERQTAALWAYIKSYGLEAS